MQVVKVPEPAGFLVVGDDGHVVEPVAAYLRYLSARSFSGRTIRSYAYDLLSYWRWLTLAGRDYATITSEDILAYIEWQKTLHNPQRPDANVYRIEDGSNGGRSVLTINRRLAAISGLYAYFLRQDPSPVKGNPIPHSQVIRSWRQSGRTRGLLGHIRSRVSKNGILLRVPQRLPRPLDAKEVERLIGSLRKYRDKAVALLMLYGGLRSCEVLGLHLRDIDMEERRVRVWGKGSQERMVPVDPETIRAVHRYILHERPETERAELFLVLKGRNRGQPLTPAGLRTIFRYHREISEVWGGNPHRLRHTYGTNMAQAGVDVQVLKELMGHASIDSTTQYVHFSADHLRREYDAAVRALKGGPAHE